MHSGSEKISFQKANDGLWGSIWGEDCAETMPPAAEPTWDAKYKRCSAGGDWCHQDVMMKLEEWEDEHGWNSERLIDLRLLFFQIGFS